MKTPCNSLFALTTDEQGQSSVLVALTAVVFIAFLIFLADMGRLVHDKMLAQAVADSAALAAANIQAIGLNEIADLNAEIHKLHEDFDDDLEMAHHKYFVGEGYHNALYYKSQLTYIEGLQDEVVEEFPGMASAAAEAVVEMHNDMYDKLYPTISAAPHKGVKAIEPWVLEEVMGCPVPGEELTSLIAPDDPIVSYNWTAYSPCRCTTEEVAFFHDRRGGITTSSVPSEGFPGDIFLNRPRIMDPDMRTYYRLRLTREPIRPLVNLAEYGFDLHVPKLVVYSQAQPHKGVLSIKADHSEADREHKTNTGMPEYEARLAPLWKVYPNGARSTDEEFLSLQDEFKH
jgi:hypothetical protein